MGIACSYSSIQSIPIMIILIVCVICSIFAAKTENIIPIPTTISSDSSTDSDSTHTLIGPLLTTNTDNNENNNDPGVALIYRQPFDINRITNGFEPTEKEYPYLLFIKTTVKDTQPHSCTGSLISRKHGLTAAHCVDQATLLTILAGAHNTDKPEVTITITNDEMKKRVLVHEKYNSETLLNDIAMIKFKNKFDKTSGRIGTVPLPCKCWKDITTEKLLACGYGRTSDINPLASKILQCVKLTAITNNQCSTSYPPGTVTDSTLCTATKNGQSTCFGDSGGPLTFGMRGDSNESLVGITSFGKKLCQLNQPIGFVRVFKYLKWIYRHSGIKCHDKMILTRLL